jgi:basic amino acid/polyamine antiporter, APA family
MPKPTSDPVRLRGHLLRILGVGFGIAVVVGETIGTGIFRTPGEVAAQLGNSAFIIAAWIAGGVYAFFCTLAVTELGTMLPRAGGWYVYSRRAFGDYGGFVVGCSDWVMQSVAIGYLAVAFGEFACELLPALGGRVKLVAIACMCLLMLLNWLGLRTGCWTQELTSLIKALALIGFVAACFVAVPSAAHADASAHAGLVTLPKGGLLLGIVIALQAVVVTYDGWYAAIYFAEEDEDPVRNLPRSSIGGVLACVVIFLLVNLALLHVLPMHQLVTSQVPAADAAKSIIGSRGKDVILVVSMLAAISTINAILMISPRILFGMARDGLMPRWMTFINKGGTPAAPLLLCTVLAGAMILSGDFEALIAVASFLFVAVYLSGFSALFVLRAREPGLSRPFRMWGYPWTNIGISLASVLFLVLSVVADPKDAFFALLMIALSYPVYFFAVVKSRRGLHHIAAINPTDPSGRVDD